MQKLDKGINIYNVCNYILRKTPNVDIVALQNIVYHANQYHISQTGEPLVNVTHIKKYIYEEFKQYEGGIITEISDKADYNVELDTIRRLTLNYIIRHRWLYESHDFTEESCDITILTKSPLLVFFVILFITGIIVSIIHYLYK